MFTPDNLNLLSALSNQALPSDLLADGGKLRFYIKLNQALTEASFSGATAADTQRLLSSSLEKQTVQDDGISLYKPLVVVGPSGAGKGTLIPRLLEKYRDNFKFSVSYTTRKPRPGEVDGVHYFFVDVESF